MTLITRRHSLALLGAALATPLHSEPVFLDGSGMAIKGYDPVAYFAEEAASKGNYKYQLETETGIWQFKSAGNMKRFEAAPEEFTPQFGGFCADGIARGFKRVSDPTVWVMVRGKLYLHYSIQVQNIWAEDIRGNIAQANQNWPDLRDAF